MSTTHKNSQFKNMAQFSINWMKIKLVWFIISVSLLGFSLFTIFTDKLNTTIDFKGGILIEIGFETLPEIDDLRQILKDTTYKSANIQQFGPQEIIVNMASPKDISVNEAATEIKNIFTKKYAQKVSFRRVETVGPKVGQELIETSAIAVFISILAMLIYIWIRFELPFAIGSVVALIHDVVITLGILAYFQIDFGLPIIAALLTIVGYSMNDTVVIYDRIRENLIKFKKTPLNDLINLSINGVLTRTLVTSGTTLIALIALIIFGGAILRPFILTMAIGVLVGTYSSIFVASPILLILNVKNKFKAPDKKLKNKNNKSILEFF